jgi:acetylornithine deacetylase/succinyl-diaminopimelate desuccinylase-like protein
MDTNKISVYCHREWENSAIPELIKYIRIPNKSPLFDPDWQANGYMEKAVTQFETWCLSQNISEMTLDVVRIPDRTPLIFMDIPGSIDNTVLLYGHLDKQPEMTGWRDELGPWKPVLDGDKLYGRGGADDGYATFASLLAVKALQEQGIPHARCVIIIEACEESGSFDLPFYIDELSDRIGKPELVICLDSGCGNYDQLWNTTSLRGLIGGDLKIEILNEGVHSGDASGIVPSSFHILRRLLNRIDETESGHISIKEFLANIPPPRQAQAQIAADVLGKETFTKFPFTEGAQPITHDPVELILNRTWRPALSITGADGLPSVANAGNVLRAQMSVKISLRLPPTVDAKKASDKLKTLLESDPPYGATVTFTPDWSATGWHAPEMDDWLEEAIDQASLNYFGKPSVHMGEGGSIPFMGMLGEKFPDAQFLITGVLGPHSNAHGPNEFLHIPTTKKLTCCVAEVIAKHYLKVKGQT